MEVILLKDVAKVGKRYDIVTVSDGFALNCLIPKGSAQAATPAARAKIQALKTQASAQKEALDAELAKSVAQLDGKSITMKEKANEQGGLFGSLHPERIASAVYDQLGVTITPDQIHSDEPIKTLGTTSITIGSGAHTGTLTLTVEEMK